MSVEMLPDEPMLADVREIVATIEDQMYEEGEFDRVDSFAGFQSRKFLRRGVDSTTTEPLKWQLYEHPLCETYRVLTERRGCNDSQNVTIEVNPTRDSTKLPIEIIADCCQQLSAEFAQLLSQAQSL
jgi:hypothetical protein